MTSARAEAFAPDYAVPPGATLADLLDELGMTQTDLADRLGVSLKHVNQIVNGAASISAELALGLEKVLGVSSDFWLTRDSLYRADQARAKERGVLEDAQEWARRFPLKELQQRGLLPADARGVELVAALLAFLGIAGKEQWTDPVVAFRRSQRFESDPYALSVWLRAGALKAAAIPCEPYDEDRFRAALLEACGLTVLRPAQWKPRLIEICANAGVAVVILSAFKRARVNGATRWLSPTKALIQVSLRYKWEDVFWFSFFHEGGHVVRHQKKLGFLEGPRPRTDDDPEWRRLEEEADHFASRLLVPAEYERELRYLTLAEIPGFAARLGVAPAIVVGRLQHDGVMPHDRGNRLRRRFNPAS